MDLFDNLTMQSLSLMALLLVLVLGFFLATIVILFVIDRRQSRDAVRHNFPVIGRFRYLFTELGEFFRQYFFALDREEMPFNRAEREWVMKSSQGRDNNVAFGSTKNLHWSGTVLFVNAPFPPLEEEAQPAPAIVIGPHCPNPYSAQSLINISGMSYGAISKPAVQALSNGAKLARCWLNTGEGGLSPYHLEGGCDLVFQIGTARYGVRDENGLLSDEKLAEIAAHEQVKMFEIKLSQGAKPGKGGILPGIKVSNDIAATRGIVAGVDSISPNRHPDVDSVSSLLDLIDRVRGVTGKPTGFKSVFGGFY